MVSLKTLLLCLVGLGSMSGVLGHPTNYNYEVDPLGGRPYHFDAPQKRDFAPPSLSSPLYSGTVITLPSHIQVFWDYPKFISDSLVVSVIQNGKTISSCNVTQQEVFYEYVSVNWLPGCGVQTPGKYSLKLEARRRSDGVTESNTLNLNVIEKDLRPWPLENDNRGWPPTEPNLAGNLMENYQSFGGASSAYWHEGLDIRSTVASGERYAAELHSPVSGEIVQKVRYSTSDLYWSLMVRESRGLIWQFHHLDPDTITWDIGDTVVAGDILGRIAYWPSSHNGALYHHVHMNVAIPQSSWAKIPEPYVDGWQYLNGLLLLDNGNYKGGLKPTTDGIMYFLNNSDSTAYAATDGSTTPTISGKLDIVINLHSEFEPTNSVPGHPYLNGLYEVGYSVEPLDKKLKNIGVGVVPDLPLIRADKTPNEWSYNVPDFATRDSDAMLRRVYKQSFSYNGRRFTSVFTYTERKLYYIVTNINRGEPDEDLGFWDTTQVIPETGERRFPNGLYTVTVYAQDVFGNRLEVPRVVQIRN